MNKIIEACVETLEEALFAEKCGADQVELCANLEWGGLTPDMNLVRTVLKQLKIPVKVMIRPRAGNFIYSEDELSDMERSIERMKQEAVGGLVLGLLKRTGEVNIGLSSKLIGQAGSIPVTFHRAVDETPDPVRAVDDILQTGASCILTSGKAKTALQGAKVIRQMQQRAGGHMTIIAAGGICANNLLYVEQATGVRAFHGTGIVGRFQKGIQWRTI